MIAKPWLSDQPYDGLEVDLFDLCSQFGKMLALAALPWSASEMPTMTIRNLPDEVHRALRVRAAQHGRSAEAEVRDILAQAVSGGGRLLLGTELRRYGEQLGGVELPLRRDPAPIDPATFD